MHKIEAAIKNMWEENRESSSFDNPMDEICSVYKEGGYSKLAEFLDKYNPYNEPIEEDKLQAYLTQHVIYESEEEEILEAEEHAHI
ncbi:MAG: hypothetical protein KAH86_06455 [Methanosarcinales archaeon]|nr:hypothetical protein [Methanosarcinales archaeon]